MDSQSQLRKQKHLHELFWHLARLLEEERHGEIYSYDGAFFIALQVVLR